MTKSLFNRNDYLDHAKKLVNGDRAEDYGDAKLNHANIAVGWDVIAKMAIARNGNLSASHVTLMMDWVKTCRLLHKIDKKDSWVDKIGYSCLGAELSTKKSPAD